MSNHFDTRDRVLSSLEESPRHKSCTLGLSAYTWGVMPLRFSKYRHQGDKKGNSEDHTERASL